MGSLVFQDYEILAADLGPENCMPDIGNNDYIQEKFNMTDRVTPEDAANIGKGMIRTLIPYTIQDGYDRRRRPRTFKAAILENDILRAVFLPELGGRLWSLYHKGLERELLYRNPVFQPANLALRNAWFSGGVEWNISVRGHTPFTCSPLYACRMEGPEGEPVLRMYEFERIRGVTYSMEFSLPEGSPVLYAQITIENTAPDPVYMYWWSNMAVPETDTTRVIVPAEQALKNFYGTQGVLIDCIGVPHPHPSAPDCTYPRNALCANDYFFRIPDEGAKWIAAVEGDGRGLLQFSTPELKGRKLFLWGRGRGGRNWSRWLAGEPAPYIEIQAGLARTQFEHFLMEGSSAITWVEGYTAAECAPDRLFGSLPEAAEAVEEFLRTRKLPDDAMRAKFDGLKPLEYLQYGSGWGCVENALRARCGAAPLSAKVDFPREAAGEEEAMWLHFLQTGLLPDRDLTVPPASFQSDPRWLPLYRAQINAGQGNAYLHLQYGVTLYACERIEEAREAFRRSMDLAPNAWACRNLAMLARNVDREPQQAADLMETAVSLNHSCRGLMVDCAQTLLQARRFEKWTEIFDAMGEDMRRDSRLQLYKAMALLELQRFQEAAAIIHKDFLLCDIKEGEISLSRIWEQIYGGLLRQQTGLEDQGELDRLLKERYPLPADLDFQMDQ